MTRTEHVAWCKQRALQYLDANDPQNAVASMLSDMSKHDQTRLDPMFAVMGLMELQNGSAAVRRWIEGFN